MSGLSPWGALPQLPLGDAPRPPPTLFGLRSASLRLVSGRTPSGSWGIFRQGRALRLLGRALGGRAVRRCGRATGHLVGGRRLRRGRGGRVSGSADRTPGGLRRLLLGFLLAAAGAGAVRDTTDAGGSREG